MTIFINKDQVKEVLDVKTSINLLDESMKALSNGKGFNSPKKKTTNKLFWWKFTFYGSFMARKRNRRPQKLCSHKGKATFVVVLYSTEGEGLLSVIEANYLGQIRTGAASGLASKYLAKKIPKNWLSLVLDFRLKPNLKLLIHNLI